MSKVEVKPYLPEDYESFKKYIDENFHEKYILGDKKYIDWQYSGKFFLAKVGNEVVGHFGARDIDYKIYDKTKTVRVLMNLSVKESYRMAGVAVHLADKVFETKNPVLVSDARPIAHKLFSNFRSSWKELGDLKRYFGVINPKVEILKEFNPFKTINNNAPQKDFKIESMSPTDIELKTFWEKARGRYPVTVERTSEYLNWRFWSHPFFKYQTLSVRQNGIFQGYLIWRLEKSEGVSIARIIDWVSFKEADDALLNGFIEAARAAGADIIDFFHSGNFYDEALKARDLFDVKSTKFEGFPILFSPLSYRRSGINIECDFKTSLDDGYFTKADGDQDRANPH